MSDRYVLHENACDRNGVVVHQILRRESGSYETFLTLTADLWSNLYKAKEIVRGLNELERRRARDRRAAAKRRKDGAA